jgi:DNA polymerase/3'-5' exonuclease PolX
MSGEKRFPWELAHGVAADICNRLRPGCERIEIAGSLRRHKDDVGDIEILYVPVVREAGDMFAKIMVDCAEVRIRAMEASGILERRLNVKGSATYGPLNKLMRHVASGIPVDLFAATKSNWFNYLVCRTGPAELNVRIASEAKRIGWKWHPYGSGFTALDNGQESRVECERDVFDFVGIPYQEPTGRN